MVISADGACIAGREITTFKIGGFIPNFYLVNEISQLQFLIKTFNKQKQPYQVIGNGSNVLFSDYPYNKPVIKLGKNFSFIKYADGLYQVGAAQSLIALSAQLSKNGISGLEFAGGIPASLGGASYMNAGAYGGQIADLIEWVELVDTDANLIRISKNELSFAYRYSSLPKGVLVTALGLKLVQADKLTVQKRWQELLSLRREKQPLEFPSAGSIFKNPSSDKSAGLLLEAVGMKGCQIGGAKVSEKHANWIVNFTGMASAQDVITLMDLAKSKVYAKFKVQLESELIIL